MIHRLGVIGAALALAIQLALPFTPMPGAAGQANPAFAEAAALWGLSEFCLSQGHPAQRGDDGKGSLLDHQCPVCQALQTVASLLPPAACITLPVAGIETRLIPIAPAMAQAHLVLFPSAPRAPPAV